MREQMSTFGKHNFAKMKMVNSPSVFVCQVPQLIRKFAICLEKHSCNEKVNLLAAHKWISNSINPNEEVMAEDW